MLRRRINPNLPKDFYETQFAGKMRVFPSSTVNCSQSLAEEGLELIPPPSQDGDNQSMNLLAAAGNKNPFR